MRGIGPDWRRTQDKKSCRPIGMRPISASGSSCPSLRSTATRTGPLLPESTKSASHRGSREFFNSLLVKRTREVMWLHESLAGDHTNPIESIEIGLLGVVETVQTPHYAVGIF